MTKTKRNFLSLITVIIFLTLAVGSAVNRIHFGAFNTGNATVKGEDSRNYLLKNDGTKIYGEKVTWKSGIILKDQISIDDQTFKISEIKGYKSSNIYYGRLRNEYIKRIIQGKLNVYIRYSEVTSTSTDRNGSMRVRTYTRTDHFAQKGTDGEMINIPDQHVIAKLVKDCPLAYNMINISDSKIRAELKKNGNFLNRIFDIYNNGCK